MAASSFPTSPGDPIADRRLAFARGLAGAGDFAAAAEVLAQALEIAPDWAAGWLLLGEWRERAGDLAEALAAYREAHARDPDDGLGAGLRIAVLDSETPDAMPAAYVRTLFDDYAPRFESALTQRLGYVAPKLIAASLARHRERRYATVIDLGCGTGLMGELVREHTDILVGVDLSERMLERAGRKAVYDRLVAADAIDFLSGEPDSSADLIVAADMVPYVGSLVALFGSVARVLAGGGVFAFSCERHDGEGFVLGEHLRYRHSAGLLAEAAAEAGLSLLTAEPAVLRREAGAGVAGLVCELVRPADIMPLTPRPAGRRGRLAKAA
ncbi:MAG: methyltransferase domain-containing protein [Bauldia sp.]|nr:methyltransferase domain-containing protein [Bauldia sp.]